MRSGAHMPRTECAHSRRPSPAATAVPPTMRRVSAATKPIVTSIGSIGAAATAIFSAIAPLMNRRRNSMMPAIGRSTIRDQWTLAP